MNGDCNLVSVKVREPDDLASVGLERRTCLDPSEEIQRELAGSTGAQATW